MPCQADPPHLIDGKMLDDVLVRALFSGLPTLRLVDDRQLHQPRGGPDVSLLPRGNRDDDRRGAVARNLDRLRRQLDIVNIDAERRACSDKTHLRYQPAPIAGQKWDSANCAADAIREEIDKRTERRRIAECRQRSDFIVRLEGGRQPGGNAEGKSLQRPFPRCLVVFFVEEPVQNRVALLRISMRKHAVF